MCLSKFSLIRALIQFASLYILFHVNIILTMIIGRNDAYHKKPSTYRAFEGKLFTYYSNVALSSA